MSYAMHIHVSLPFEEALTRTREALTASGFGIPTELDTQAVFKSKLGLESERRVILGACLPQVAFDALHLDPDIATLLPCNVVVREVKGGTDISAIRPTALLSLSPTLPPTAAQDVEDSLARVLDRLLRSSHP